MSCLKHLTKVWITFWLALLVIFPTLVSAQEVDFNIISEKIHAQISSDGSVRFREEYIYDVDYMNGALFQIDRTGYELKDYQVGVKDNQTQEDEIFEETPTGASETYQVSQASDIYEFKVYYPAQNEKVTFVLEYTLTDLVTNFSDTAEFNRKIVGQGIDDYLDIEALIVLPGKVANQEDFRAWGHGAPQGEVELVEYEGKSAIKVTVPNNPPKQFVEVNSIFPIALTPNNQNKREVAKKDEIIKRENDQVERDRESYATQLGWIRLFGMLISILMPALPIGLLIYYLNKKKSLNPNPIKLPDHIYTLPEDITPALMSTSVFKGTPSTEDFTATIVDLARKGYLVLTEVTKERRGLFSRGGQSTVLIEPGEKYGDDSQLQKHEKYALQYVMPTDQPVTLQELEESASKDRSLAKKNYNLWTRFVNFTQVRGMQLKGNNKEQKIASANGVMGLVFIPIFVVIAISLINHTAYQHFIPWIAIIGGASWIATLIIWLMVLFKPIRTADQDRRIQEWTGFKNMLNDIGNFNMREIGSLELWEEFLVYAISLGVADKVVEAMKMEFKPVELEQMRVGGGFYSNPYILTRGMNHSINNTIGSAQPRTTKYSGTNTGGFGGGFSGGSSGGSGGGSGAGGF